MNDKIKSTIREGNFGYITCSTTRDMRLLPFYYTYIKGKLYASLSIIQEKELEVLRKHPYQYLTLDNEKINLGILGKIQLYSDDLDESWRGYQSTLFELLPDEVVKELGQIPHLQKAVVVEFIPTRIDIVEGNEIKSIEMEIVI